MAEVNTAIIILASVQSASTLVLVAVTAFYARTTAKISDAAQRQADATAEMVREMRDQTSYFEHIFKAFFSKDIA